MRGPPTGGKGPRRITLVRASHPDRPAFDTAVSHAILEEVAAGRRGETFRLYLPGRVVAFGRRDAATGGYREAVRACRALGYEAVERLAGGRAAVFHEGTLAFSWAIPTDDPLRNITARFTEIDRIVLEALGSLGFDARVGEVAGEYCPGRYSVNLGGQWKVMGVGQRLRRGVAHVGGVVAVCGHEEINAVLTPVYRALSFAWKPAATGSLQAARADITTDQVSEALVAELSSYAEIITGGLGGATLELAARLVSDHLPREDPAPS